MRAIETNSLSPAPFAPDLDWWQVEEPGPMCYHAVAPTELAVHEGEESVEPIDIVIRSMNVRDAASARYAGHFASAVQPDGDITLL